MKRLIAVFLSIGITSPSWGAVAFNNANTADRNLGTSYSGSMSVTASGTNRVAVACIGFDGAAGLSITAVTYGGTPMVSAGAATRNTTSNAYVQIFTLANPATGANTLAVTGSASVAEVYANLVSFTGVDQTVPVRAGTFNSGTGNSANPAITITSNANDKTFTCIVPGLGNVTATSQTSNSFNTTGTMSSGSDRETGTAASVLHTWTTDSAQQYALAGISLQTVTATGSSFNKNGRYQRYE